MTYQTCALKPQIKLSEWDILSSLPNALIILDAQRRIVWLNPSAEAMLGYGLTATLWLEVTQKAFVQGEDDGHGMSLVDGRRVHVAVSSLDSLPGVLITLSDITATREYEKAQENEQSLVSIGTMTAQLAHQIRTPLSSAMLYTDHLSGFLGSANLGTKAQTWVHRLQECHASIEQQIQDLLLFARGTVIPPSRIALADWCTQLMQRATPQVESYSASFKINNFLKTRESFVHGESLIGAVLNLVINALQSEAREIHLTLASIEDSGIQMVIEDDGKGMSEEVKAKAFLPFYTTRAQGTGLGLAVVFAVVKGHGGKVVLESTEGVGTQVTIWLPGDKKNTQ